jgi:phosphate:Na+ symporter
MFLDQPAMAFDRVRLELARVGDKVLVMVKDSFPTLLVGSRERILSLQKRDEEIDALTDAIVLYLRRLATADLVEPQPVYLQQHLGIANYLEKIADVIETGIAADAFKRLDQGLEISEETEEFLRDIYKELYLAAQMTLEAVAENSADKANEVQASKQHFNGLVERARGHLYIQLRSEKPERLREYKLESNTLENFKRIHNMLRSICKLILERGTPAVEAGSSVVAGETNGRSA